MSLSPFDAIAPIAAARPAETTRRGEVPQFGPALAQACSAERPPAAAAPPRDEKPAGDDEAPADAEQDAVAEQDQQPVATEEVDGAEPSEPDDETERAAADSQDAVVIAEAAAAASAAAQRDATAAIDADAVAAEAAADPTATDAGVPAAMAQQAGDAGKAQHADAAGDAPDLSATGGAQQAASPAAASGESEAGSGIGGARKKPDSPAHKEVNEQGQSPAPPAGEDQSADPLEAHRFRESESTDKAPAGDDATPSQRAHGDIGAAAPAASPNQLAASNLPDAASSLAVESGDSNTPSEAPPPSASGAGATPSASERAVAALDRLSSRVLRNSDKADSADPAGRIDRDRFVQRVEGALRAAQQRDGKIQIRLSPPELGNLRIELAVHNGVLAARLEAETPGARNVLLESLPQLRDRLAQQDVRIERFDVDVRRDGGNSNHAGNFDRPDSQPRDGRTGAPQRPLATRAAAAPAASAAASGLPDAGDIVPAAAFDDQRRRPRRLLEAHDYGAAEPGPAQPHGKRRVDPADRADPIRGRDREAERDARLGAVGAEHCQRHEPHRSGDRRPFGR
ncbi:MAG: hypothetical protein DCC67_08610 [Planctomycetota bacterium]|nr:MAG: hypothetical protein DCC67_08610 [Planctomycetota bacterium]